jgi:uncharacterized protein YozE (UPF0346 family)
MKQSTKIKIQIIIWALFIGLITSTIINRPMELWEKISIPFCWVLIAFLNIKREIKNRKDLKLIGDNLIIKTAFSKESHFNLKHISSWTENHYYLLGFKTSRQLLLKQPNGKTIYLIDYNATDFEKISDYLNDNLANLQL